MRKIILIVSCIACYHMGNTCYNETHYDKNGKPTQRTVPLFAFYRSPDTTYAKQFIDENPLSAIESYTWEMQSDLAVKLAYLGRLDESLQILRRLQRSMPNEYIIAANIGTTYELMGKNDSALFYIKKGIEIDPDSHNGSEWVHIKILEAKLALTKDPNWLSTHSVLGTGVSLSSSQTNKWYEQANHVEYQMQERVPFTPMPDKLLANVFNELGDLYATQHSAKMGYIAYQFSFAYDPTGTYGVKEKMKSLENILKKSKIEIPQLKDFYLHRHPEEASGETAETKTTPPATTVKTDDKKEGNNKSLIYILAGACTLMLAYLGVYFYRQKRSGRV